MDGRWSKGNSSLAAGLTATLLLTISACGSSGSPVKGDDPPDDDDGPPPLLTGTVIAKDSFDVTAVAAADVNDPDFLVTRQWQGVLPSNLGSSAGNLLVLSVRDLTNPEGVCGPGDFVPDCAAMVVLERDIAVPGRRPGRLTIPRASGGQRVSP